MPRVGSTFSGVGGFELGLERAGFAIAYQAEADPFCQRVLARRWPNVRRFADVRHVADEPVEILVGGFPCQDLSVAGKRAGLGGERSGLFWEIVRIAKIEKPTWGLFENVPGLVSSHRGSDMALVIAGLRECWPVVGWRILDSRYFGVAQRRRRVFFVCGPTEAGVAQVLALTEGGEGDPQAGGEAGAEVARAVSAGAGGSKFGSGRAGPDDFVIAPMMNAYAGRNQLEGQYTVGQCHGTNVGPMGTLRKGNGNVSSGVPFVAETISGPLGGADHGRGRRTEDDPNLIAFDTTQITSKINRNNPKAGDPCHPLAAGAHPPAITGSAVRRLSPVECERLQGFPDGFTCLCQPIEAYAEDLDAAALRCSCPDSPRYRALGNAVTVNVVEWLGRRLVAAMRAHA